MMSKWRKMLMAIIKTGHRGWNHSGVKVYDNAAAPTEWTDLDLSSIVGKNRALVFMKLKNRDGMAPKAAFVRSNGETEDVGFAPANAGMNNLIMLDGDHIAHFAMETDENGIIEWKATADTTMDIWVIGYIR